jgi:hypothetical protein
MGNLANGPTASDGELICGEKFQEQEKVSG